jgi:asparagine synthase (glutamine-hydrolysing)
MCGIVGIFSYGDQGKQWHIEELDSMIHSLSHRGPDDRGRYSEPGIFMGHTRLSIIDTSSSGHQPMFSRDGRYVICFNGEIYNFKEIRALLEGTGYYFRSRSDTEVLLTAWQAWGDASLNKLDGIFAFAIFDRIEKTLFLARDHLGVKPLFYLLQDNEVLFASEYHALFNVLKSCPDIAAEDLDAYFTFNYLPTPRTGLKDLYQLQAGHYLVVNANGIRLCRYWKPEYAVELEPFNGSQTEHFREILFESVASQMVSDVPLGLFLSGGIDSFAVSVAARRASLSPLTSFTLGFDNPQFDESPEAALYAEGLGILNERSLFAWNEEEICEVLKSLNELLADSSCFPVYQLSRFAREKVAVTLSGDGGDELLAGYDTYKAGNITPFLRIIPGYVREVIKRMALLLPSDNRRYGWRMVIERLLMAAEEGRGRDHASFRRIFSDSLKRRLYQPEFLEMVKGCDPIGEYAGLMDEVPRERSYLSARQHADLRFHLPAILSKVDRMSMAHGLEVRVPLLSKEIVEFCINLPDNAKRHRGRGKRILCKTIEDEAPAGALSRPKAGFLPPVDRWFRYQGPMFKVFSDYLVQAKTFNLGWLKWDEVDRLWSEHKSGKIEAGFVLLGILQFINWRLKCRK